MLANLLRPLWNKIVIGLGKLSLKMGVGPDTWTFLSLGLALLSAIYISEGSYWMGLGLSIAMFLADALDGATARAKGIESKFGMILDHVVGRYAEFILFGGLLLGGRISSGILIFSLSGVFMASYVRAKAESTGDIDNCAVGITGRAEKLILTYCGIALLGLNLASPASFIFLIVGLLSHVTAVQRILYARSLLTKPRLSGKKITVRLEN